MSNKPKYTVAQMCTALAETKGLVYLAARRLGCNVNTVLRYCQRYPAVEAVKVQARGELLDEAELRLWRAIQRDEAWAIAFCLKTIGRSRGYAEHLDVHLQIEAIAARVAGALGLRPEDVLQEAQLLLKEMDHEDLQRPTFS
jgi:hypothetical protein